jgi:hypothetical protein
LEWRQPDAVTHINKMSGGWSCCRIGGGETEESEESEEFFHDVFIVPSKIDFEIGILVFSCVLVCMCARVSERWYKICF